MITWTEIFKLFTAMLGSIGGAAALIFGLSKYFGGILTKRLEQKFRAEFQNEINEYQSKLDVLKQTTLRYSDRQFELYSVLWTSLHDLKISADNLWSRANSMNLNNFAKQIKKTKIEIERASLFIEDDHYRQLMEIIKSFSEFEIGKERLIDLRQTSNLEGHLIERQMIAGNQRVKQWYDELIVLIKADLKRQLKGK
ncbi:hypothetical protein KEM09_14960 [Carboxylicivirga mesophila]|uniref:Uncharacterized protein n=1 Tax=Carboxylicivirga mesophila TaxID=1166478 RepID=A0ABS5KD17_9BACT|nr:hypothetical protein [Carboxylicivirga mesophila]MBS2212717.1 hypothetical protein [Carboxylicivirga mesophila]